MLTSLHQFSAMVFKKKQRWLSNVENAALADLERATAHLLNQFDEMFQKQKELKVLSQRDLKSM